MDRKERLKKLMDEALQRQKHFNQHNADETLTSITKSLKISDDIIREGKVQDRIRDPTEVVLDASVLQINHELMSKVFEQSSEFNQNMFVEAINNLVGSYEREWGKLALTSCLGVKIARIKSTMLGCVEREMKETVTKARQKRKTQILAEEKKPKAVETLSQKDDGMQKMKAVFNKVKNIVERTENKCVPFYALITHPTDFMQTIDNAFQMSFMARERVIAIEAGDDGFPMVRLTTEDERSQKNHESTQSICKLDMQFCAKMVSYYKVSKPMLN